ncbi:hypothetical protein P872_10285 [Rhodonellum psychrophilum GCM71 = DSM 17998]|uniref:Uncharacterized protein n=1 Tax=Rhodonellum psychrophilum GCM71 = DSM 17998 TaxID=1123057 RepID=U5BUF0_9BACT|nr:hypothetical protein P872_10285 [Rhodonellum psychrophilum GCM71 = DSM 17998]
MQFESASKMNPGNSQMRMAVKISLGKHKKYKVRF